MFQTSFSALSMDFTFVIFPVAIVFPSSLKVNLPKLAMRSYFSQHNAFLAVILTIPYENVFKNVAFFGVFYFLSISALTSEINTSSNAACKCITQL